MNAYRVELLILDFDEVGDQIKDLIEDQKYPNYCISPKVMEMEKVDIGPWSDDHPLNSRKLCNEEFKRLFKNEQNYS